MFHLFYTEKDGDTWRYSAFQQHGILRLTLSNDAQNLRTSISRRFNRRSALYLCLLLLKCGDLIKCYCKLGQDNSTLCYNDDVLLLNNQILVVIWASFIEKIFKLKSPESDGQNQAVRFLQQEGENIMGRLLVKVDQDSATRAKVKKQVSQ